MCGTDGKWELGGLRLDEGGTELTHAMAQFDCTRRYLRNGYYFAGAP